MAAQLHHRLPSVGVCHWIPDQVHLVQQLVSGLACTDQPLCVSANRKCVSTVQQVHVAELQK